MAFPRLVGLVSEQGVGEMSGQCSERTCKVSIGIACQMGEDEPSKCPFWKPQEASALEGSTPISLSDGSDERMLPWSGNALGTQMLEFVAARQRQTLIGLVGPYNAGKTTLLAMIYLLFTRGAGFWSEQFAGSYTLEGWENIAHNLHWNEEEQTPHFPEHTSSET